MQNYHKRPENIGDNARGQGAMAWVDPTGYPTETQQKRTCLRIPAQSPLFIADNLRFLIVCLFVVGHPSVVTQHNEIVFVPQNGASSTQSQFARENPHKFGSQWEIAMIKRLNAAVAAPQEPLWRLG
jgi:hypothetical protein